MRRPPVTRQATRRRNLLGFAAAGLAALAITVAGCNGAARGEDPGAEAPGPEVAREGTTPGAASATPADTATGVVAVVGADPLPTVVLRRDDGSTLTLRGPLADTLQGAQGLEVSVTGEVDGMGMVPAVFRVRRMDALPAADGTLELDGTTAILVTPDGSRLRYPLAPAPLRALAGRRVWIAAQPGTEPQHWGALDRR